MDTRRTAPAPTLPFFATARPPVACAICGATNLSSQSRRHSVVGEVCPVCFTAAADLETAYYTAEERQRREFRSQLAQMVRDRRAGGEIPDFYRGEIA